MSSPSLDVGLKTLRASIIEGKTDSIRFRQDELQRLHAGLVKGGAELCGTIAQNSSCSVLDAEREYYLTMDAIRKIYETLDFDRLLKEEYLVKDGKDHTFRRVAVGIVAIRPGSHSRFYSVLTAVSTAIAAGNCVLLELSTSDLSIDSILKGVLQATLDIDAFHISSSKIQSTDLAKVDLLVDQTSDEPDSSFNRLSSSSSSISIVVVDRSGDFDLAARAIAMARQIPHDTSPYSPRLVLVNEWDVEAIKSACLKYTNNITNIIFQPCTSITATVSLQRASPVFLAAYIFAELSVCKFLSERLSSHVSYINQIPLSLLYGPASPTAFPHSQHPRYTLEMFSVPRPQIVSKEEALPSEVAVLRTIATKNLKATGQRPGHAVGFFEQGIFLGLGVMAFIVIPTIGWGTWTGGKLAWRYAASNGR